MTSLTPAVTGAVLISVAAAAPLGLHAQEFDLSRAAVNDSTVFAPFVVGRTEPLRDALRRGAVDEDTPMLVLETRAGPLALATAQMAYHHAAQGEIAGEPWMVSF